MQLELFCFDKLKNKFITAVNRFGVYVKDIQRTTSGNRRTAVIKQNSSFSKKKRTKIDIETRTKKTVLQQDQFLTQILINLQSQFFPDHTDLLNYRISWSTRRQKRTLASCNIRSKKINVAKELNHPDHTKWLEPLIYHEMCHAVIGKDKNSGRNCWHGRAFRELETQHPLMKEFNIWVKSGGWRKAVMSERTRSWWKNKKLPH